MILKHIGYLEHPNYQRIPLYTTPDNNGFVALLPDGLDNMVSLQPDGTWDSETCFFFSIPHLLAAFYKKNCEIAYTHDITEPEWYVHNSTSPTQCQTSLYETPFSLN